jgi:uncharacterized SAM-binding protein YcdF (DUF218 family)
VHARSRLHRSSLLLGIGIGALAPFVLGWAIDSTTLADWLVKPLQRPDTPGLAQAIVVLGAGSYEPCGCNLAALRRTELAVKLFETGRAPSVIFTGGPSPGTQGEPVARSMAALARRLGVPAEAIVEETRATTTAENARYTSEILRERNLHSIILVTDSLHMRRAEESFRAPGLEIGRVSVPQVCVSSSNVDMLRYAIHEYAGWLAYRLRGTAHPG